MMDGVYIHPAGQLSRRGVVDVGLKCPHSCQHCFYSYMGDSNDQFTGMRHAAWHRPEILRALVTSLKAHGFIAFDVTGGEPSAYPHLVEIIQHATDLGLASRIITLAQFLGNRDLLSRLLDAGLTDCRFSLHAVEAAMFAAMTGGELQRMIAAMDRLQGLGFQYITNTTITELNYKALPAIARFIAGRPEIYQATFLMFMPYYQWSKPGRTTGVRVKYSDAAHYLREAVAIVEAAGIGATVRYAPQCTIHGMEKNHVGVLAVRYDIHEWMNAIDHNADPATMTLAKAAAMGAPIAASAVAMPLQPVYGKIGALPVMASRANGGKYFPSQCRACRAIEVCDGIDAGYLLEHGAAELKPYLTARGNPVDWARLDYRAGAVMKLTQHADAKSVVRQSLKEKTHVAPPLAATA